MPNRRQYKYTGEFYRKVEKEKKRIAQTPKRNLIANQPFENCELRNNIRFPEIPASTINISSILSTEPIPNYTQPIQQITEETFSLHSDENESNGPEDLHENIIQN